MNIFSKRFVSLRMMSVSLCLILANAALASGTADAEKPGSTTKAKAESPQEDTEAQGSGIFKRIDESGRVTFTDQPSARKEKNAKEVELKEAHFYTQPKTSTTSALKKERKKKEEEKAEKPYQIWFTSPGADEKIGPATKSLNVKVRANRYTPHYLRYRLYWDGTAYGNDSSSGAFSIPLNLRSRGKRSFYAELINTRDNKVVTRSQTMSVFVIRP